MIAKLTDAVEGAASKQAGLMALRVSMAGLMFWWGLVKGLNTGVGQAVSERFYGGAFSFDVILIAFGWIQVLAAIALALGVVRRPLLVFQLVMNVFVAASVATAFIDPFWLWLPGEKPSPSWQLFYPSVIVAAASWLLLAFRDQDRWAFDRVLERSGAAE
ncbi:MAG: hypothetical protein AAF713_04085 [Pseudomonadota bacterium]